MTTATTTRRPSALDALRTRAANLAANVRATILGAKDAPRVGRPIKRDLADMVNHVSMIAEAERDLRAYGARVWYVACALLRRDLTDEEREAVALTPEAQHQGVLPCGDPAQTELFIQTPCRVTEDDTDGSAFVREAKRALGLVRYSVQREHEERTRRAALPKSDPEYAPYAAPTSVLRVERNVITRAVRNEQAKSQRAKMRAHYGCRFYGTDRLSERPEEYTLAVVTPNEGERTILASYEWLVEGMGA